MAKRKVKKKELSPREKFEEAITQGKILAKPIYEGVAMDKEMKLNMSRSIPVGYVQLGVAQGITFCEDESNRSTTWHRLDYWLVANVEATSVDETREIIDDYVVDVLYDKCQKILDEA